MGMGTEQKITPGMEIFVGGFHDAPPVTPATPDSIKEQKLALPAKLVRQFLADPTNPVARDGFERALAHPELAAQENETTIVIPVALVERLLSESSNGNQIGLSVEAVFTAQQLLARYISAQKATF